MSASTVDPALAELDPASYVEAVAAVAINDEDSRWREQAALWRGVIERHQRLDGGPIGWLCPDVLAVVTAARAYAGGDA